ncbi:MAG: tetratricopeptide repeat protein [Thiogranum sp.]|nr:tetratricopeptide repeat protein [Thiogranum sp.]
MSGKQLAEIFRQAAEAHQHQRHAEAQAGYRRILQLVPAHFDVLHLLGQSLIEAGQPHDAIEWLRKAVAANPASTDACFDLGLAQRKAGQSDQAVQSFHRVLELQPDYLKAHLSLAELKFPGERYTTLLRQLHQWLKPANYVEIGVETGQSMALAEPRTRCVGVDPEPRIQVALPPRCEIFAQTSDAFFAEQNLHELLGRQPVAFAFIDGMHVFEAALRDFINIEACADPHTVVAIHDCIPLEAVTSARERTTNFWSGDVWKLIPCLKKYRPDLEIINVATKPTGLGIITGLERGNRRLLDCYAQILEEFIPLGYNDIAEREAECLNVVANEPAAVKAWLQDRKSCARSVATS